jgi:O-antigen biosynthesis protein
MRIRRPIAKLMRVHERLTYERLPIATLLQSIPGDGRGTSEQTLPEVGDFEIDGVRCDFVSARAGSRLAFRTRVSPDSLFSAWIFNLSPRSDVEFTVAVQSEEDGELFLRTLIEAATSTKAHWRRVKLSLDQFAGREITLLLSAMASSQEDIRAAAWGDPRILRKRAAQEYYAKLRSRFAEGGIRALLQSIGAVLKGKPDPFSLFADYPRWVKEHSLTPRRLAQAAQQATAFGYRPLVSILTPTFNTDPEILRKCIQTVQTQIYPNWELCICDDCSSSEATREVIAECARADNRIKTRLLAENRGIADATNEALSMATGEFVGLLDHDDELSVDALYENVRLLQESPQADVIYSDEDKLDVDGKRCEPFFKPDWSPELLLSGMYTSHFSVYRRELVGALGGFRRGFEGSQDYDLMLRVTENSQKIFHIPKILYHWRKLHGSTASEARARPHTTGAGLRALRDHVRRIGLGAEVFTTDLPNCYRVSPFVRGNPLVSIIIPHKDQPAMLDRCLQSIKQRTTYRNYELVIVDNASSTPQAREFIRSLPYRVISFDEPFNFSRVNNLAARECSGSHLLFLNDDTEVISPCWLTAMLGFAQLPEIGAVGAKLYYPDDSIQHAGVVVGMRGIAGHWLSRAPRGSRGYFNSLFRTRNFSAVTAACALLRREVFESVGGFDEQLPSSYNDVDLCLRIRQAGYRIVWVPEAELYHCESASRSRKLEPSEVYYMKKKWNGLLLNDPYYNPNLVLDSGALALR